MAKPLADITRVTEAVAAGEASVSVPFSERRDEIGALARSIAVFQRAMRHNEELNRTVRDDAETRTQRQEQMSGEISRFSAEVEATLAELGRISDQMLAASTQLASAADDASAKTERATTASSEASANVRDIASAADELSASVNEIDRQVAQSNAIATKAVNEAGRTNVAVKELDEAAGRIGDVVKLITDIAEQTNLLALNATIEAARAGEAGRGFAVVAGEVKALAGQTSRATEEISAQIAGMQRATVRSIEAITAIEHIIREIGDISGAIAAAVTEQGAATQEIARSVEIAAKRTVETADEVNLVGTATARHPLQRRRGENGGRRSRRRRRPHPRPGRRVLRAAERCVCAVQPASARSAFERRRDVARQASGATRIASKRISRMASSGLAASQTSAAAAIRRCCRSVTDSAASSSRARAFTSTKTSSLPRRAIDVDLAERAFPAPRQDAEALGDQPGGGAAFRRNADPECRLPLRPRRRLGRARR